MRKQALYVIWNMVSHSICNTVKTLTMIMDYVKACLLSMYLLIVAREILMKF